MSNSGRPDGRWGFWADIQPDGTVSAESDGPGQHQREMMTSQPDGMVEVRFPERAGNIGGYTLTPDGRTIVETGAQRGFDPSDTNPAAPARYIIEESTGTDRAHEPGIIASWDGRGRYCLDGEEVQLPASNHPGMRDDTSSADLYPDHAAYTVYLTGTDLPPDHQPESFAALDIPVSRPTPGDGAPAAGPHPLSHLVTHAVTPQGQRSGTYSATNVPVTINPSGVIRRGEQVMGRVLPNDVVDELAPNTPSDVPGMPTKHSWVVVPGSGALKGEK